MYADRNGFFTLPGVMLRRFSAEASRARYYEFAVPPASSFATQVAQDDSR